MSDKVMEGGCACGLVRYHVVGDPIFVNNCHCTQCQRQTGSTSAVNMFYETDRLVLLSGDVTRHVVRTASGGDHAIVRCAACGTSMWSHYPWLGDFGAGIRVGTLDDSSSIRPDAIIFASERMPWVVFSDDIPVFDTTYRPAEVLPEERFARLKALSAKARAA